MFGCGVGVGVSLKSQTPTPGIRHGHLVSDVTKCSCFAPVITEFGHCAFVVKLRFKQFNKNR